VAQHEFSLGAIEVWIVVGRWTEETGWNFRRHDVRQQHRASMSRDRRAHLRLV
jgi:hypothetical protein